MDCYSVGQLDFIKLDIAVLHPSFIIIKDCDCAKLGVNSLYLSDFSVKNTFSRIAVCPAVKLSGTFTAHSILQSVIVLYLHNPVAHAKNTAAEFQLSLSFFRRVKYLLKASVHVGTAQDSFFYRGKHLHAACRKFLGYFCYFIQYSLLLVLFYK